MLRIGTKSAVVRCAGRMVVAAFPAAAVALAVLPPSLASAAGGWSAPVSIDPDGTANAVSCPSTAFCMVVGNQPGNQGYAVSWDGSTWSAPAVVDPDGILLSVSCASASFCVAADSHGYFVTWNGTSWSAPLQPVRLPRSDGAITCE